MTYPALDEIFELTLDGDAPENRPLEMVRADGYDEPEKWKHTGLTVTGQQTRRGKLVLVGYCDSFDEVKAKLAAQGTIPEGQWREAFKARYPTLDGKGSIGVADASWASPHGGASFPYVDSFGFSLFDSADGGFDERWRWLVLVGK
ncbi:MAG: hypothetical protein A3J66_02130 [Candidatus Magasanikbacteria bacterium RIFCSPHIGHO2_02_FULL_47_14]|uniref:Uncharacterized protein n=1 Tax=Candidatus Magasanikbacteria bacterium RIFCSPHIGHO2_02_FULL_47_14 TaxID=1798680 RepID=A0A1F6MBH6_9BACT|nr:MAG: hypothetical protein A3J66_02130 [Candidatus Magasanikbacteria bacterium RIFCSPHIGHO2_02_FULL_47_14]